MGTLAQIALGSLLVVGCWAFVCAMTGGYGRTETRRVDGMTVRDFWRSGR